MFLHNVKAQEYKGFKNIHVEFKEKFTVLCGPNGVGKSTVLFAIASALNLNNERVRLNEHSQCKIEFTSRDSTENVCGFGKGSYKMESLRSSSFQGGPHEYQNDDGSFERIYKNDIAELFSPLFIGPNRNIDYKKINGMTAEKTPEEYRKEYITGSLQGLASAFTPEIKQWMINRYFIIEKEWGAAEKYNWDLIISNLDFIFGGEGRVYFDKIGRELEPSFILDGAVVYLEDLSSGFKSILSIVLSIVEWIEKTNANDDMLIDKAQGVVLIDEIDAHLHPSWQTSLRGGLIKIFPRLQFIVTTHSPHIISSSEVNEVIVLRRDGDDIIPVKIEKSLSAWKTDDIYSLIMGVNTVHQLTLKYVISEIEDLIENELYEHALMVIEDYAEQTPESDPTALTLRARVNDLILKNERDSND